MLSPNQDTQLFLQWSQFIEHDETRAAFHYLVGIGACLENHNCHVRWKGQVRDFRFYDTVGEQPFSFITNKRWLLFYFRPPAVRSQAYSKDELSDLFDSFSENTAGEWTIKIRSIADVDRIADYIGWT